MYDQWKKFQPESRTLRTFEHWLVVQRTRQVTLGSCVFLPKREIAGLPDASSEELQELSVVAAWFESKTIELFRAEKFNYVAAMMKDPYLHFHAFPRYSGPREAFGRSWADTSWPKVVQFEDLATEDDLGEAMVLAMQDKS